MEETYRFVLNSGASVCLHAHRPCWAVIHSRTAFADRCWTAELSVVRLAGGRSPKEDLTELKGLQRVLQSLSGMR